MPIKFHPGQVVYLDNVWTVEPERFLCTVTGHFHDNVYELIDFYNQSIGYFAQDIRIHPANQSSASGF
jgi:hypothetical protein